MVSTDAAARRVALRRLRRELGDAPEDVDACHLGDWDVARYAAPRECRCQQHTSQRRLVRERYVDILTGAAGRTEGQHCAAANPFHVQVADWATDEGQQRVEWPSETRRHGTEELLIDPLTVVKERPDVMHEPRYA